MGRAAAFSSEAKLSLELKAMLKAVDGKTSVTALVVQFPAQDGVDLLSRLEEAGLIKLRSDRLPDFLAPGVVSKLYTLPAATPAAKPSFAVTSVGDTELLPALHETPSVQQLAGVARIVEVMATFVLTHIPQQAFTVLAKLESFQTLGELEAELPGYALMAKESGPAGIVHLAELTERLREAAAA